MIVQIHCNAEWGFQREGMEMTKSQYLIIPTADNASELLCKIQFSMMDGICGIIKMC